MSHMDTDECRTCGRLEEEVDQLVEKVERQRRENFELTAEMTAMRMAIRQILAEAQIRQGWQDVRSEGENQGSWTT